MRIPLLKLSLAALLAFPLTSNAILCVSGKYDKENRQAHKWSTCVWLNDADEFGNGLELKSKPGKNDEVQIRARTDMLVDMNVDVRDFSLNGVCSATFDGKNLVSKKGMHMNVRWGGTATELFMKNATAEFGGGIRMYTGDGGSNASIGLGRIKLENSTLNANGSISYSVATVNAAKTQADKGGAEFHIIGKSLFNLKGELFFDPILLGENRRINITFIAEEKDGNVPQFKFGGGSPKDIIFDVRVSRNAKKGKFDVVTFGPRKNISADFNKVTLNGKEYEMNSTVEVGDLKATIRPLPAGNGLQLEIK